MITVTTDVVLPVSGDITYIRLYAKQNDTKSRFLRIKLADDNGNQLSADGSDYKAYIRAIKPDKTQIFDVCSISADGCILVSLSDQLLACVGTVKSEIAIYSNEKEVLSSSVFDIEVVKSSYDEDRIISSSEFSALTEALSDAHNAIGLASSAASTAYESADKADNAATDAKKATEDAKNAVSAIYHDKNFILELNEDSSLSLTYNET